MISILIVEDEFLTADFIKDSITEIGYNVSGMAGSAEECMEILASSKTDLIFLDINIDGDIDGIQLAHKINKKYKIPFIFLTSYLDKKTVDAALIAKPSAYITKPFNKTSLYASIEVALKNHSTGQIATSDKNVSTKEETFLSGLSKDMLFIKHKGAFVKIKVDDILYFHSELKFVDIYTLQKRYSIRYTLPKLIAKLKNDYFVQCHRSYAVNLSKVSTINASSIYLEDKTMIPMSLSYKKLVIDHLDHL